MLATLTVQQEAMPIIRSGIEMKRKALEFNLRQYQARLSRFEDRYAMSTDQFAHRFAAGELGDEADWFEWEYVLDVWRETDRQLKLLGTVRL